MPLPDTHTHMNHVFTFWIVLRKHSLDICVTFEYWKYTCFRKRHILPKHAWIMPSPHYKLIWGRYYSSTWSTYKPSSCATSKSPKVSGGSVAETSWLARATVLGVVAVPPNPARFARTQWNWGFQVKVTFPLLCWRCAFVFCMCCDIFCIGTAWNCCIRAMCSTVVCCNSIILCYTQPVQIAVEWLCQSFSKGTGSPVLSCDPACQSVAFPSAGDARG